MSGTVFDKAFWQSVIDTDCAVPAGHTVAELTPQLLQLLGSTDPFLRDDVAYLIFARWIVRDQHYAVDDLRGLIKGLTANLHVGLGEQGTDTVLLRSFSALVLSLVVYLDVHKQWLSEEEVAAMTHDALAYLLAENDLRGHMPEVGWHHAVAHTADWLKFLARHPKSDGGQHLAMLNAIADKLMQPVTYIFTHDEDERLVMAIHDILKRGMVGQAILAYWLERFQKWKKEMVKGEAFDPTIHAPYMNIKNFVRSLYFTVQIMANKDEVFKPLEQEALGVVRAFGSGTIYMT